MASSYSPFSASSSRHRVAASSNSPAVRRNRVERNQKWPILASTPTPDRKRTIAGKQSGQDSEVETTLANLPVLALTRIVYYLPMKDRLSLSQTCRKLRQAESYSRRHRCQLNVRLDLLCCYKEMLQSPNLTTTVDTFGSLKLFHDSLRRSMANQPGAICRREKIACIDFSPPDGADRKRWGGRMILDGNVLSGCFGDAPVASLVELHIQHCYVPFGALDALAAVFVNLEKLSVSLKGLQFTSVYKYDEKNLDYVLSTVVENWPRLVTQKKSKPMLNIASVKEMILFVHQSFLTLETLLIYNN